MTVQDIDDLIINIPVVLDVGHYIGNDINSQCFPISIGESVGAVPMVHEAYRVGIKSNCGAIGCGVSKSAIAMVFKNICMTVQDIDDLIIDIPMVLDVGHYVGNDINGGYGIIFRGIVVNAIVMVN